MKGNQIFPSLLVLFLGTLFFSAAFLSAAEVLVPSTISIIFTTRTDGVLKDCGCEMDCQGGLAERLTLFRQFRERSNATVFLDAGDFSTTMNRQRKNEIALRAYELLDYDAVGIGDQEFICGEKFLNRKILTSGLPMVCANLVSEENLKLLGREIIIKKINQYRLVITSVISESAFRFVPKEKIEGTKILPWLAALKNTVAKAEAEADLIILLAQLSAEEIEEAAHTVPEIDLIVSGHWTEAPGNPLRRINDKIIVDAGVEGAYVGLLEIALDHRQIKIINFDLICLNETIPEAQAMKNLIEPFTHEFESFSNKKAPGSIFFGAEYCRQCHVVEYDLWAKSKHAAAAQIFFRNDLQIDTTCSRCHSMSGISPVADSLFSTTHSLIQGIQCENCHQFGAQQIDPALEVHSDSAARQTCAACHDQKNSPQFKLEKYWEKIKHD